MSGKLDDDMTELVDADIPRLDFVDKGANGRTFLLMKNAADDTNSLLSPDQVAELIKNDEAEGADMTKPTDEVEKADDLDVTKPLAGSGDPTANAPGSPEWEKVDADTAAKWIAVLSRASNALALLAEREAVESTVGEADDDEYSNIWDLEDAREAVNYAINLLAGFGAREAAEADLAGDEVGKAVAALAPVLKALDEHGVDLVVMEGVGAVAKANAGVLSEHNEGKLAAATLAIKTVLADITVPENVEKAEPEEEDVAKVEEEDVEKTETPDAGPSVAKHAVVPEFDPSDMSPAAKAARILKANAEAPVEVAKDDTAPADDTETPKLEAVFDANGNLKGVVDPTAIQPVEGATADEPETPAAPAAVPAAAPAAPAVPAAKAAVDETQQDDEPKAGESITKADLDAYINERVEAGVADVLKEVEKLRSPAQPRAARYGKFPAPTEDRGQAEGSDVRKSDEEVTRLQTVIRKSGNPAEIEAARTELTKSAAEFLAAQRAGRPVPQQAPRK